MGLIEYVAIAIGAGACLATLYLDFFKGTVRLLPALLILLSGLVFQFSYTGSLTWESLGLNLGFLVLMALMTSVAIRISTGDLHLKSSIGLGDAVMFLAPAAWLDAPGFALFLVSALVWVLASILWQRAKAKGEPKAARFAGILATWLLLWSPVYWWFQPGIRLWFEG